MAALALLGRDAGRQLAPTGPPALEIAGGPVEIGRPQVNALIDEAAAFHGVSVDLVRAVVEAESSYDPDAVSPAGAQGLMQLMPTTAAWLGVADPLDPRQNVFGGVKYLSRLLDRFGGDVALSVAAYNAGPAKVARYGGIPPYRETRGYVARIRKAMAASTGLSFPLPKPVPAARARPTVRPSVRRTAARR